MEKNSLQEDMTGNISNIKFIQACPHDLYFIWQVEVNIVNFRKHKISHLMHVLVWYPDNEMLQKKGHSPVKIKIDEWVALARKYPEVSFSFYKDTGVDLGLYIPQLRPQILAKHFDMYPHLKNEVIFYHDSDIIFNYLPDFQSLAEGAINWQSDTSHYLDYDYLRRKEQQGNIPEHEAIETLAKIGNVTVDIIKSYTGRTGGAQYILKGIDGDFWRDVERQCVEIRKAFSFSVPNSINKKYFKSEAEGFQSWCADMWAVNMALWSRGKITDVTSELDFSWATDSAETYQKKPIFHNAGATKGHPGLFYKGDWIDKSPLGKNHAVKKDSASWFYVEAMKEVK